MYAIRTINWDLFVCTEIESGIARLVAIQAMRGNVIPKTMSTTTVSVGWKFLFRKSRAKLQT
jgi:hypothetical protein